MIRRLLAKIAGRRGTTARPASTGTPAIAVLTKDGWQPIAVDSWTLDRRRAPDRDLFTIQAHRDDPAGTDQELITWGRAQTVRTATIRDPEARQVTDDDLRASIDRLLDLHGGPA